MIKWVISWIVKMGLLVLAYVGILYGVTMLSSELAVSQTMAILSKYSQGDWESIQKSIATLFPYLSDFLDTLLPFLKLINTNTIESPLGIVYDLSNALILAFSLKVFELIYQGIILPISKHLLGISNRLADLYASVIGAYASLFITDVINIHTKSFFDKIYYALPFQLLPNLTVGAVFIVCLIALILLTIVGFIWLIGRKNASLMTTLGKSFLDILLGMLISAMTYLLAGSVLTLQTGNTLSYGTSAITMISCILGITIVSAILFKNSILKFLK